MTTIAGVEQIDEDRFQFFRRADSSLSDRVSYERVIFNRADKSITSELVMPFPDGSPHLFERGTIQENAEGQVVHNHLVFETQGIKSFKIDFFKLGVEKIIKAIKFSQFENESQ